MIISFLNTLIEYIPLLPEYTETSVTQDVQKCIVLSPENSGGPSISMLLIRNQKDVRCSLAIVYCRGTAAPCLYYSVDGRHLLIGWEDDLLQIALPDLHLIKRQKLEPNAMIQAIVAGSTPDIIIVIQEIAIACFDLELNMQWSVGTDIIEQWKLEDNFTIKLLTDSGYDIRVDLRVGNVIE